MNGNAAPGAGACAYICNSGAMLRVREALDRVSATDARVVLYGEPGVGKSHAARRLHAKSSRSDRPLARVSVRDVRAIDRLLDPAFLKRVEGGTLVLDGVDEAPAEVQAALIGLVEEWDVPEKEREVPIRIVSTSQCDLLESVAARTFRADLYYVLEVFPLEIPPLRDRLEEIPLFLEHFCRLHFRGSDPPLIPDGFLEQALSYRWPGNLRELENMVVASLPARPGDRWELPRLLPEQCSPRHALAFCEAKREFEQSYIRRLLTLTGGNVTRAAVIADKARKDFYALMARNQIDPEQFRARAFK